MDKYLVILATAISIAAYSTIAPADPQSVEATEHAAKADYKAAKKQAKTLYKAAKAHCRTLTSNDEDVCLKRARAEYSGREKREGTEEDSTGASRSRRAQDGGRLQTCEREIRWDVRGC
jgi:hypothetical protein